MAERQTRDKNITESKARADAHGLGAVTDMSFIRMVRMCRLCCAGHALTLQIITPLKTRASGFFSVLPVHCHAGHTVALIVVRKQGERDVC